MPTDKPDVENDAMPPLRVTLAKVVVPSRNVTTPVAVDGETVAVNVTVWPDKEGLRFDAIPMVLEALFTNSVIAAEVLPL